MKYHAFKNISKERYITLGIIGGLALTSLFVFYFSYIYRIKPMVNLRNQISSIDKKIKEAERIINEFVPVSLEEKRQWQKVASRVFSAVPLEKDLPELFYELARLAKINHIKDISFNVRELPSAKPQGRRPVSLKAKQALVSKEFLALGKVEPIWLEISFHADYKNLVYFLSHIQHLPRFINIEHLEVKRTLPMISARVLLKAYYLKEPIKKVETFMISTAPYDVLARRKIKLINKDSWERNPFLKWDEIKPEKKPQPKKTPIYNVEAIIISGSKKVAIVNGNIVMIGDWLYDEQVVDITREGIVLKKNGKIRIIKQRPSPVFIKIKEKNHLDK